VLPLGGRRGEGSKGGRVWLGKGSGGVGESGGEVRGVSLWGLSGCCGCEGGKGG
jgi:hypothetical protein